MFKLEFSKKSKRFLKNIDKNLATRILIKLDSLKEENIPNDAKFLGRENNDKVFRIRIGGYRVLYKLKKEYDVILITKIGKRSSVYDKN